MLLTSGGGYISEKWAGVPDKVFSLKPPLSATAALIFPACFNFTLQSDFIAVIVDYSLLSEIGRSNPYLMNK
jgi:hypothetical protein